MPHTLLLADDSVTIQRVIELTFADEDVKVVAVSDGDQAIARLDAAPPDIVLADVGMPGKNGYEVAQYVKRSPHLSHIPVVLLTGAFEPVDQARAANAGCDGVLAKPFEPQLVIGRVKELLARSKGDGPAPAPPRTPDLDATLAPPPAADQWAPLVDQSIQAPRPTPGAPADIANYFDRLDAAFANLATAPAPASDAAPPTAEPFQADMPEPPMTPAAEPAAVADEIDWFNGSATAPAADPGSEPSFESAADQAAAASTGAADPELEWKIEPATPAPEPQLELQRQPEPEPEPVAEIPPVPVSYASPQEAFDEPLRTPETPAPETAPAEPEPASRPSLADKPVALPPLADAFAALLAAEQGEHASAAVWPSAAPSTDAVVDQITRRVLDQVAARLDASVRGAVADLVSELAERMIREEIERIKSAIE